MCEEQTNSPTDCMCVHCDRKQECDEAAKPADPYSGHPRCETCGMMDCEKKIDIGAVHFDIDYCSRHTGIRHD